MADMNDISGLLTQLLSSDSTADNQTAQEEQSSESSGIDPEMLIKIMEIISRLNENDKNSQLLAALRPHLREENRRKLDKAAMLMKLMSILPLLREGSDSNLF